MLSIFSLPNTPGEIKIDLGDGLFAHDTIIHSWHGGREWNFPNSFIQFQAIQKGTSVGNFTPQTAENRYQIFVGLGSCHHGGVLWEEI